MKASVSEQAMKAIQKMIESEEKDDVCWQSVSAIVTEWSCYDEMKKLGLLQYLK